MRTVLVGGVFSILHAGHLCFLEEAKKLGDKLVVVVANDKTIERLGKKTFVDEKARLEMLKALRVVDEAILGDPEDLFNTVLKIKPDVIALGHDQEFPELEKRLKELGMSTKVVKITECRDSDIYKSSKIIERIIREHEKRTD